MPDDKLVELTSVSTGFDAEWIVGALKGLDISAVAHGELLTDEFSMSQQMIYERRIFHEVGTGRVQLEEKDEGLDGFVRIR